jgi:hypothetical protein
MMYEWLMSLGASVIPIILFLCGALIAITAIVSAQWRKVRQTELEIGLKQDMLNRGMSAEEIERIIHATRKR